MGLQHHFSTQLPSLPRRAVPAWNTIPVRAETSSGTGRKRLQRVCNLQPGAASLYMQTAGGETASSARGQQRTAPHLLFFPFSLVLLLLSPLRPGLQPPAAPRRSAAAPGASLPPSLPRGHEARGGRGAAGRPRSRAAPPAIPTGRIPSARKAVTRRGENKRQERRRRRARGREEGRRGGRAGGRGGIKGAAGPPPPHVRARPPRPLLAARHGPPAAARRRAARRRPAALRARRARPPPQAGEWGRARPPGGHRDKEGLREDPPP